ncbi:MAG: DUF3299 domain-containing protein [Thiothrix sp.]|nr:MAG: DUF3299 domain-containing protein [Thiothrix sp.]
MARVKPASTLRAYCLLVLMGLQHGIPNSQADVALNSINKLPSATAAANQITDKVRPLDWIDLLPAHVDRQALMEHYADLVIQRLDPPADLQAQQQILKELQQAPINKELEGLRIRLAGYMTVLNDLEGKITEFLLVPYSGAGIYQPAPPANQMILVRLKPEQALSLEQAYESVWVEGRLKIQAEETSIAQVSYLLDDAQVRLYTAEDARQAAVQEAQHEHEHEVTVDHAHED